MSTKKRINLKYELERSGEKYLKVFREQLQKSRPKGRGFKGQQKSEYSPKGNTIASGNLYNKSSFEVIDLGGGDYDLLFSFPDYIQYLEKGVRPKTGTGGNGAFLKDLKSWVNKKLGKRGKDATGLAYAIRTNIFKYGIAPTRLLEETTNIYSERYAKSIAKGYLDELEDLFFTTLQKKK